MKGFIKIKDIRRKFLLKAFRFFLTSCIVFAAWAFPCPASGQALTVHFIDVGYGDAILLETSDGESVLIDAGPSDHAGYLMDYLDACRVKGLQAAILTHPHANHFEGFSSVIRKWPIGRFYLNGDDSRAENGYKDLIKNIEEKGTVLTVLKAGDELSFGDPEVRLAVLHPSACDGSANENALVLWIVFNETSFLITSDIQEAQQDELLARYPQVGTADVVQVPHHGGKITERFADFFGNKVSFVVSTGTNRYEKPFMDELNKLKGKVFRTDLDGPVVVHSDGYRVEVTHGKH